MNTTNFFELLPRFVFFINIIFYLPSILYHLGLLTLLLIEKRWTISIYLLYLTINLFALFFFECNKNVNSIFKGVSKNLFILSNFINFLIFVNEDLNYFLISVTLNIIIIALPFTKFVLISFYIFCYAPELVEALNLYPIYPSIILNNFNNNNNNNEPSNNIELNNLDSIKLEKLNENLEVDCSICLNQLQEEEFIKTLECDHKFHQDCLDKWLINSQTCPICRNLIK